MTSDPAYLRDLRALTRANPEFGDIEELERELYNSSSDRATVVMFGSFVENHLEALLMKLVRQDISPKDRKALFEYEGAFGTFSSKILSAYALGLIGPIARFDLNLIRLLRNEFAHSRKPFGFRTPQVQAVCDQFKIVDLPDSSIPHGYLSRVPNGDLEAATDLSDPKTRFISVCHNVCYRMLVKKSGPQAGDRVFVDDEPLP